LEFVGWNGVFDPVVANPRPSEFHQMRPDTEVAPYIMCQTTHIGAFGADHPEGDIS
jgi:hypothetical protein